MLHSKLRLNILVGHVAAKRKHLHKREETMKIARTRGRDAHAYINLRKYGLGKILLQPQGCVNSVHSVAESHNLMLM